MLRVRELVSTAMVALATSAAKDDRRSRLPCPLGVYSVELLLDTSLRPWLVEVRLLCYEYADPTYAGFFPRAAQIAVYTLNMRR